MFFDLIARIIPGSVALLITSTSYLGADRSITLIADWLGKDLVFPSVLLILVAMVGISYVYAIVLWRVWYGMGFGMSMANY